MRECSGGSNRRTRRGSKLADQEVLQGCLAGKRAGGRVEIQRALARVLTQDPAALYETA